MTPDQIDARRRTSPDRPPRPEIPTVSRGEFTTIPPTQSDETPDSQPESRAHEYQRTGAQSERRDVTRHNTSTPQVIINDDNTISRPSDSELESERLELTATLWRASDLWIHIRRSIETRERLDPQSPQYEDQRLYERALWELVDELPMGIGPIIREVEEQRLSNPAPRAYPPLVDHYHAAVNSVHQLLSLGYSLIAPAVSEVVEYVWHHPGNRNLCQNLLLILLLFLVFVIYTSLN